MHAWQQRQDLRARQFTCGYCGRLVASDKGYGTSNSPAGAVHICPNCSKPSYFYDHDTLQVPGVVPGNEVAALPNDVNRLYREARRCVSVNANTAAVLACRKLLMNIAVSQGAAPGESFVSYVEYLANNGFVPPNGRGWVDHIRRKGNEATHEILLMTAEDANELILFAEMLLKFIFEFPSRVPPQGAAN